MAASTNPSGNKEGSSSSGKQKISTPPNSNGASVNPTNNVASSSSAVAPPSATAETQAALRHNPGISVEWTPDEQYTLDDLLAKYASDSNVIRYAKIAMQLKDKTVRDVALRCNWMTKKESGKRRREDHNSSRKNKERKEKSATDSSTKSTPHLIARPNGPPYAMPMIPVDNDDGISYQAIGGPTGELLEQNSQMFTQISANFAAFQIHDNVNLLSRTRDNILAVLNDLNDAPDIMRQMPPLPVKMNEELANSILPRPPQ